LSNFAGAAAVEVIIWLGKTLELDTLTGPLGVWKVVFTDGTDRLAFIGAYESKRQMLVSVVFFEGQMLWNFMHTDAKSLNKHRHGELLYKRYTLL
jgi:hypothetical protein